MIEILGVKIDNLSGSEVFARLHEFFSAGKQHMVATPNPEMLVDAQKDSIFRAALNSADLAVPDGAGLVWISRLFYRRAVKETITGNDVLDMLFRIASKKQAKVFFLGGAGKQAEQAAQKVKEKYPQLTIESNPGGPIWFDTAWHVAPSVLEDIRRAEPDILAVALGHGKQEKFIKDFLPLFPTVKIAIGIGGAFTFLSGAIKRAPRWMRDLGFEWLWRLIKEPSRYKRIWKAVVVFQFLVICDIVRKKFMTNKKLKNAKYE